jgi:hypothetical protein
MLGIFLICILNLPGEWLKFHCDLQNTGFQPELKGCLTPDSVRIKWESSNSGFARFTIVDINNDGIPDGKIASLMDSVVSAGFSCLSAFRLAEVRISYLQPKIKLDVIGHKYHIASIR